MNPEFEYRIYRQGTEYTLLPDENMEHTDVEIIKEQFVNLSEGIVEAPKFFI